MDILIIFCYIIKYDYICYLCDKYEFIGGLNNYYKKTLGGQMEGCDWLEFICVYLIVK